MTKTEPRKRARVPRRPSWLPLVLAAIVGVGLLGGMAARSRSRVPVLTRSAENVVGITRAVGMSVGPSEAALHVVVFGDYACGHCGNFDVQVSDSLRRLAAAGRLEFKFVPFPQQGNALAYQAALAALCSERSDRRWAMHEALERGSWEWSSADDPEFVFLSYAGRLGVPTAGFSECMHDPETVSRLEAGIAVGRKLGVRAVPQVFIGDDAVGFRGGFAPVLSTIVERLHVNSRSIGS